VTDQSFQHEHDIVVHRSGVHVSGAYPSDVAETFMQIKSLYPHFYHKTDCHGRPVYYELIGELKPAELLKHTSVERLLKLHIEGWEYTRCGVEQLVIAVTAVIIFKGDVVDSVQKQNFPCMLGTGRPRDFYVHLCFGFERYQADLVHEGSPRICSTDSHNRSGVCLYDATECRFASCTLSVLPSRFVHMQNFYPEHLGQMFIINAPMVFKTIWAIVRPWLEARTQKKIQVLSQHHAGGYILWTVRHTQIASVARRCFLESRQ
jgi:hypothetical protein